MTGDFISMSIKQILENGINLFLDSIEEEQHYLQKLFEHLDEKTDFTAYLKGDTNSIEVENKEMSLVVELLIAQSTLYFIPYGGDIFDIFTSVLGFIAREHVSVMQEFRGIEEIKIESIKDVNKTDVNEEETENIEEETSSDDDYEWI